MPRDDIRLEGRQREQDALAAVVRDARLGTSRVRTVFGEPGIGKTALLQWAAGLGRAEGMDTLTARGIESEAEVPFAGLLELLRPALEARQSIPAAQAEALQSALDLGPTRERDRFLIGAATLNLLSVHSERAPLVIVVDDAHWLDDSSLAAMLFAARRLVVDPIAMIFAARTGEAPLLEAARLSPILLDGVDAEAAAAIVRRHAPTPPDPGVVQRLGRVTGGNPLALTELAAAAGELEPGATEHPLEIETSVARAYGRRIAALPVRTQHALALAAAEGSGRLGWIGEAAEHLGLELADLEPGERSQLVSIAYGTLSWRHPLVRSSAYQAVTAEERRAIHAALARSAPEAERDRQAWHLAAAALGPDGEAATALEEAARRARSRGAYATAAAAAERAARLTPDDPQRARRLFMAAEAAWLGGNAGRALERLGEARALTPDPRLSAEIEHLRGQALVRAGEVMAARDLLVEAATATEALDPAKAIVMLAEATDACVYAGRPGAMLPPARRAFALLSETAGERERFFANLAIGTALIANGADAEGARRLRDAVAVLEASDVLSLDPRLLAAAALGPLWLRERRTGASLIGRAIDVARGEGALGALPFALMLAGRDAATTERWPMGRALYEEAIGTARESEQAMPLCGALAGLASLQARTGQADACVAGATEAIVLSERHGLGFFRLWALDALTDLALGLGRLDDARAHLEARRTLLHELESADPDLSPAPELVEIGVRSGRLGDGDSGLEAFADAAQTKGQPWSLARLARARGLLAGEEDVARHFAEALELHAATPDRFEEGRTLLCFGERLRRIGQRVRAREQLNAALEIFADLGATPWLDRASGELLATGEKARRRVPSTIDDLTPQELQVATTIVAGNTTRETAAQLFLSPKTVEYHLRNAYRKLGIRSRDELAEALAPGVKD